jgi:parallel beta-helix repeat protein
MTMRKQFEAGLAGLALVLAAGCAAVHTPPAGHPAGNVEVVHVAPPTGDRDTDRASILAALEQVEPGGTIQFAPGTYLLGGFIPVSVSGVTLLGHPSGTTLLGCDPAMAPPPDPRVRCNTLALIGSRQAVRNLTFEYMSWGLTVGFEVRGNREFVFHSGEGGHLIEGNTFRDSWNGVRAFGDWPEPVVVRGNRFINTYHAGDISGRRVHFLNNDISAPDPSRLTPFRHVGAATQIQPLAPVPADVGLPAVVDCEENVIAGNRYDGHPDAILMEINREGSCRNNVIRHNTIIVRRARFFADRGPDRIRHETDSTFVGIPLRLADYSEEHSTERRGVIENNVIEGNRIIGAEGLGIMLHRASRNRVAHNTITGIRRREPFPGNVLWGIPEEQWRHANGSAIWVSPGSEGNEIRGNTFEDIASAAVFLEGDSNQVILQNASDSVRDLGNGNRVSPSDSVQTRIIQVDGYTVHVYTAGWEHLERGQPVVVFEAGGFSTLDAWGDLPARLAQETAVVAYDRAGRGRSEWDGQRPTLEHVTSRLRRILEVLNAPPPYIHVGHSFGGPLGLAFAREYPDELAGLVLVDPTPPAADWLGAFDDIGVGRAGYDEFDELFSRAFEGAPESLLIELDVLSGYLSDPEASPWSPPHLSVPVAVLLAGAGYEVPPDLPSTWDLDQQHQALLLRQIANYAEWTRTVPDATMIVANNSRHCIHCWDPELVIGAIRRVLYSDVRVQLRQAMAADGITAIKPTYDALRSRYPDSHFDESRLELLGRELLGFGESEAAIAVFGLNAREYSDVVRPHESLGDAYRAAGRLDDARESYERALQLAETNASTRLPALRRKLERVEREQQRSLSDSSQDNDRR